MHEKDEQTITEQVEWTLSQATGLTVEELREVGLEMQQKGMSIQATMAVFKELAHQNGADLQFVKNGIEIGTVLTQGKHRSGP